MPSVTPVRSPPAAAGAALVVSPMTPSHTPGCLERRNLVIARSEHTAITPTDRARLSLLTRMLRSPLVDLYANGPQHQFAYYLIWHMFLFYMVYMYQHAECYKDRYGESNPINLGLFYACYDEILPFCLYTGIYSSLPAFPTILLSYSRPSPNTHDQKPLPSSSSATGAPYRDGSTSP